MRRGHCPEGCGAHKADLLRYALLWFYGGTYCDVKSPLLCHLGAFLSARKGTLVTCRARNHVHQGFLAAPPRHPVIRQALDHALRVELETTDNEYMVFCTHFHSLLKEWHGRGLRTGWNTGREGGSVTASYLLEEKCAPALHPRGLEDIDTDGRYLLNHAAVPVLATRYGNYEHAAGFAGDVPPFPSGSWRESCRHPKWCVRPGAGHGGVLGSLLLDVEGRLVRSRVAVDKEATYENRNGCFQREGGATQGLFRACRLVGLFREDKEAPEGTTLRERWMVTESDPYLPVGAAVFLVCSSEMPEIVAPGGFMRVLRGEEPGPGEARMVYSVPAGSVTRFP